MMRVALLALITSCMVVSGDPTPYGAVYACRGVEVDIFFEVCVAPGDTPEQAWARIEEQTHYDCKCSISCRETYEVCNPQETP